MLEIIRDAVPRFTPFEESLPVREITEQDKLYELRFRSRLHQADYHTAIQNELFRERSRLRRNPGFRLSYLSALNAVALDETLCHAAQERRG